MSETSNVELIQDVDRLTKWRNERLEKAEAEKQERIKANAIKRQTENQKAARIRLQAARALLPDEAELELQEQVLRNQQNLKSSRIVVQFAVCVLLPIFLAAYYLFNVATPLYEAKAVVVVTNGNLGDDTRNSALMSSLSTPVNLQDAFVANAFIQSSDMAEQLETDASVLTRWSGDDVDPIQRLRTIASLGITADMQVDRFLDSHVDIQTGLLTIQVKDMDRVTSEQIADRVIALTTSRLSELSDEKVRSHVAEAEKALKAARTDLESAQETLAKIRSEGGEVDPRLRVSAAYESLRQLEAEAMVLESEVERAQISGRGDSLLVSQTRELAERTRAEIEVRRANLIAGSNGAPSLNSILMDYDHAQLQVRIAENALASAFDNLAVVRRAAAQNRSLVQVVVPAKSGDVPVNANGLSKLLLIFVICLTFFAFSRLWQGGRSLSSMA